MLSPHSGLPLHASSPFCLTDGEHRYPLIEGIPYLRTNRETLCQSVLTLLEKGESRDALHLLLQDQDDWSRSSKPEIEALSAVTDGDLSLREAMQALNFGPVADYFAYRWSDPTFLSGLALLEAHLPAGVKVLELACGIGHYLREFELRDIPAIGADVVFAKLWLARRYLVSTIPLICCDAHSRFPLEDASVGAVFCHDAFYFLRDKARIISEMQRVAGDDGAILIGHTHCREASNFSAGEPLCIQEYAALLPDAALYDDAELTASLIQNRRPRSGVRAGLPAIALATGVGSASSPFTMPAPGAPLRINPLLSPSPQWPSQRYQDEYAHLSGYLQVDRLPEAPDEDSMRRRIFVSLPDRW